MHEVYVLTLAHALTRSQFGPPSASERRRDEQAFYEQHAPARSWRRAFRRLAPLSIAAIAAFVALAALSHYAAS